MLLIRFFDEVGGEFFDEVRGDAGFEVGVFAGVAAFHDLGDGVEAGDVGGLVDGDAEVKVFANGAELGAEFGEEGGDAFAGEGGEGDVLGMGFAEGRGDAVGKAVNLVEHHQRGFAGGGNLVQDGVDGGDLFLGLGMADVDDVEKQVGLDDFFEGGLEGFDKAVGELLDEADGVGQQHVLVGGQLEAAGGGVEGGEKFVFGEDGGTGELVEESGFAGVGVADDGGEGPVGALAAGALGFALAADGIEVADDTVDAFLGFAAVGFELGFTFAAAHADAAGLAGKVGPEAGEAGQQVLELGKLDLEFAFAGAGALGKDIKDEGGAVQDLALEGFFEVAGLGGGKFVVEDDGIDVVIAAELGEFGGFAFADVGGGVGVFEFLGGGAGDFTAGGLGEFGELLEGFLNIGVGGGFEFHADEEDAFGAPVAGLNERFQVVMTGRE